MLKHLTLALFAGVSIAASSRLAGGPNGSVASCDPTRLADVAFLVGRWQVQSDEPAVPTPRQRTGTATVQAIAGGCALQENLRLDDGFEEVRILAFDERDGTWQFALVDSEHGNLVTLTGHATQNGLEFISTHQRPDRLLVDRVLLQREPTGWGMRVETAPGYGAAWRLLQESTYTKQP